MTGKYTSKIFVAGGEYTV